MYETVCETVPAKDCNLETVIKKKPLMETICNTVPENKCEVVIKQEKENECKTITNNVCEIVDKKEKTYIQVTIYSIKS